MGPARLNLDAGGGSGSGGGNNRGGSTVAPGAGALGLDVDDELGKLDLECTESAPFLDFCGPGPRSPQLVPGNPY